MRMGWEWRCGGGRAGPGACHPPRALEPIQAHSGVAPSKSRLSRRDFRTHQLELAHAVRVALDAVDQFNSQVRGVSAGLSELVAKRPSDVFADLVTVRLVGGDDAHEDVVLSLNHLVLPHAPLTREGAAEVHRMHGDRAAFAIG